VIAHRKVRERLTMQSTCGPRAGTGLPTVTFDSELILYADDEEIGIIKLPAGHTDGDDMVYFKKANVVATGDAFFSNGLGGPDPLNIRTMTGVIDEMGRSQASCLKAQRPFRATGRGHP
jgi:glyoxylase-like metal-dependent hydrolase (beta-lactamase superfamily II)